MQIVRKKAHKIGKLQIPGWNDHARLSTARTLPNWRAKITTKTGVPVKPPVQVKDLPKPTEKQISKLNSYLSTAKGFLPEMKHEPNKRIRSVSPQNWD